MCSSHTHCLKNNFLRNKNYHTILQYPINIKGFFFLHLALYDLINIFYQGETINPEKS